ncbi:hypothetical protein Rs2_52117 [Raphanus sativus]|nr:hypothetical protein Rs2_52117 [Raphanus sativus]
MNPQLIKEVYNKVFDFPKTHTFPLVALIADGLANADGHKWAKHRKIINPAFHFEKIKNMVPTFQQSCSEVVSEWVELVTDKGSSCELQRRTKDIYTTRGTSKAYHTNSREELHPWISGSLAIEKRRRDAGEAPSDDLLGLLLESNLAQATGNGLTTEELLEECKLFYFAGQETTSVLLAWTMVLLSQHQHWQARAREEVMQVFGDREPDIEGINQLKLLYPPLIQMNRAIHKEIKLGDLTLPAGVQVSMPVLLIHRDTKLWGDDAAEFKPERFKDGISKEQRTRFVSCPLDGDRGFASVRTLLCWRQNLRWL